MPTTWIASGTDTIGPVRDARQVADVARWLRDLDRRGELRANFEPDVAAAHRSAVIDEEGWVLGVSEPPRAVSEWTRGWTAGSSQRVGWTHR